MRLTSIAALAMKNDIGDLLPKHCTKREQYPLCRYVLMSLDFFPPNHFIDYTYIALDDLDYLVAYLVGIVWHRNAVVAIGCHADSKVNGLEEALFVNA